MWSPSNCKYVKIKKKDVAHITRSTCTTLFSKWRGTAGCTTRWRRTTDLLCGGHRASISGLSFAVPINQFSSAEHRGEGIEEVRNNRRTNGARNVVVVICLTQKQKKNNNNIVFLRCSYVISDNSLHFRLLLGIHRPGFAAMTLRAQVSVLSSSFSVLKKKKLFVARC